MDKAIKEKWIADLRSGKYGQLRKELCSTFKPKCFYCIGVLALQKNIVSEDGILIDENKIYCGELASDALPMFGLSPQEQMDLIHMNDIGEFSFSQIADYIEANL